MKLRFRMHALPVYSYTMAEPDSDNILMVTNRGEMWYLWNKRSLTKVLRQHHLFKLKKL